MIKMAWGIKNQANSLEFLCLDLKAIQREANLNEEQGQ